MQVYIYTARSKPGDLIRGEIEAESESAAAKVLIQKSLFPIHIMAKSEGGIMGKLNFFDRITTKDRVFFSRQLSTLIAAGLPVAQSLETLVDQTPKASLRKVIGQMLRDIESGSSLSQAFGRNKEVFSDTEVALIASGEASGTLEKVLERLSTQIEKDFQLKRKIRGAFTYPVFVMVVVVIIIAVMLVVVVPKLQLLYSDFKAELPFLTQIVVKLSNLMIKYWWAVILMILGTSFGFRSFINTPYGRRKWDLFKIKVPVVKILINKIYLARFSLGLSTLIGSGVSILESLGIVSTTVGNVIYHDEILAIAEKVKGGTSLAQPIKESALFPSLVAQMIKVGEQTGELDNILTNLAKYYDDEVDNIVKNLTTVLEPFMIVMVGISVGVVLVAIIMPIYGLAQVIFK